MSVRDRRVDGPQAADLRDRPTSELVRLLAEDTTHLVRAELRLARLETQERLAKMARAWGVLAAAATAALLALGALTACLIAALDEAMATWLAALIVTAVWTLVATIGGLMGRRRVQEAAPLIPERTIEEAKEDVAWLQQRTRM